MERAPFHLVQEAQERPLVQVQHQVRAEPVQAQAAAQTAQTREQLVHAPEPAQTEEQAQVQPAQQQKPLESRGAVQQHEAAQ